MRPRPGSIHPLGYPLDSGARSGSGLVGQTIAFCRLSTPRRSLCPTDHKKRWSVPPRTAAPYLSQAYSPIARILAYSILPDRAATVRERWLTPRQATAPSQRSEEHTSELQSL